MNSTTADISEHNKAVPSALLTPEWVTKANMKSTVVKDNFVPKSQICARDVRRQGQDVRPPARSAGI